MKWLIGLIFCATLSGCARDSECELVGQRVEWRGVLTWSTSDPFSESGGVFLKTDLKSRKKADYQKLFTSDRVYDVRVKAESMAEGFINRQKAVNGSVDIRGRWSGISGTFDEVCGIPGTSGKFFEVAAVSDWGVVK